MLIEPISPHMRARPVPKLPVADMVVGQTPEAAASLLPRLFNLCRVAQGIAARAAFGLPLQEGWRADLRREILKEHVLKLCLKWPRMLCLPQVPMPSDWATNDDALRRALWGDALSPPASYADFLAFLASDAPIASVLSSVRDLFPAHSGSRCEMPVTTPDTSFESQPQENSVAARHAQHPVMRKIEARYGRGPLWSATAVLYDIDACLENTLPSATFGTGCAFVPAARGLYAVRAGVTNNLVTSFSRVTPTDHLLIKNGILDQSLATLPANRAEALAPIVLSILDPCFPVSLEHNHGEVPQHA